MLGAGVTSWTGTGQLADWRALAGRLGWLAAWLAGWGG